MRLKKHTNVLLMMAITSLWGCAPTEEEKKLAEEEEKNKPSLSIQPVGPLVEPDDTSLLTTATVIMSKTVDNNVTFNYTLTGNTALSGTDFETGNGTLTIPSGSNSASIDLTILADDLAESDESFSIVLSSPVNAKLANATEVVVIQDSALDLAEISFVAGSARVPEGAGEYKVKLTLSTATEKNIQIPFGISGLATETQDYIVKSPNPISVLANETEVDIVIEFIADTISEGGESLIIQLGTPVNADLGDLNSFIFTIAADVTLNDTGIITWYDGLNFAAESPTSLYPGQDADSGRDTENNDNFDGPDGFSFTNLDHSGNVLQPGDSSARCVQDNRTGLVFELKQSQQLLLPTSGGETLRKELQDEIDAGNDPYNLAHTNWQASNFQYYWYNDDNTTNGGSAGAPGGAFVIPTYPVSRTCAFPNENMENYSSANTACNTLVYANALNSSSFCGFKDWKLPTVEQLRSIHNYRDTTSAINGTEFFTNTETGYYISSTPSADGSGAIWCMSGSTGQVAFCNKNLPNYVRMVRGGAQ